MYIKDEHSHTIVIPFFCLQFLNFETIIRCEEGNYLQRPKPFFVPGCKPAFFKVLFNLTLRSEIAHSRNYRF